MLIYLRILKESFAFAINALRTNKLRTFLSLVGVTIGIFSIIAILAAVDSLKKEIESSISGLDISTMVLTHMSFGPTEVPRWRWEQFPQVTYEEFQYLERNLPNVGAISYSLNVPTEPVKYEENQIDNVIVATVTDGYYEIEDLKIEEGRFFNAAESHSGSMVVVVGDAVARKLYGNPQEAIGKNLRMYGRRFTVIGVLKKEGAGIFGGSKDDAVIIPVTVAMRIYGSNNKNTLPQIVLKPKKDADIEEFKAMVIQNMRLKRGIKSDQIDTFFINEMKGFTALIDEITGTMNLIGMVISGFSLLVGGFGIANIMFVSVKERTNLIGIQKSLGAKNRFILFQFLFEAVILAVIGGIIGLLMVFLAAKLVSQFTGDFEFVLSIENMAIGASISAIIGLISGILPAVSASRLDPVEAIRTGM